MVTAPPSGSRLEGVHRRGSTTKQMLPRGETRGNEPQPTNGVEVPPLVPELVHMHGWHASHSSPPQSMSTSWPSSRPLWHEGGVGQAGHADPPQSMPTSSPSCWPLEQRFDGGQGGHTGPPQSTPISPGVRKPSWHMHAVSPAAQMLTHCAHSPPQSMPSCPGRGFLIVVTRAGVTKVPPVKTGRRKERAEG